MAIDESLRILESAISDVGHWRYWAKSDTVFQIEFGWVMLFIPSDDPSRPPSSTIALRFNNPRCVVALQHATEDPDLPDDWFAKLGRDEIEAFGVTEEAFTLTDVAQLRRIYQEAARRDFIVGSENDWEAIGAEQAFIAFWAQNVGLVVVAESLEVSSHQGRIEIEDIGTRNAEWWKYWREYWARIRSDNPMPKDSLCEITIPLAE